MSLLNSRNRVMLLAAGVGVLAACYAVAAWGQATGGQPFAPGNRLPQSPTVTVASLRIPEAAWRHFNRAKNAEEHHRAAEFERESAEALAIAPRFASMYMLRAAVEMSARNYEAALASAQAAVVADPGAMWTSVVLAGAYNGMHRFKDALLVLNAAHGIESDTWQAAYERARAETGSQDVAEALYWSGLALQSAPRRFLDMYLVRANALLLASRFADAAEQLDRYLQAKGPQQRRDQVLVMREAVQSRIAVQDLALRAQAVQAQAVQAQAVQAQAVPRAAHSTALQPEVATR